MINLLCINWTTNILLQLQLELSSVLQRIAIYPSGGPCIPWTHVSFWRALHTLDTCTPVEGPAYPGHMYPCGGPCIPWTHVPLWRALHTLDTCTPVEGPAYPGHMYPCGGPCIPWTHVPLWRALHTLDTSTDVMRLRSINTFSHPRVSSLELYH